MKKLEENKDWETLNSISLKKSPLRFIDSLLYTLFNKLNLETK